MVKLKELYLCRNDIKSIPPQLGNLSNLELLSINYNPLTTIPEELGNLKKLQALHVDERLRGSIPAKVLEMPAGIFYVPGYQK